MASLCNKAPCASRQTTLHPVRKPGSMPSTRFCPSGGASRSCRKFSAKTRIASSSAICLLWLANSVSMAGFSRRLNESSTAFATCSDVSWFPRTKRRCRRSKHSSASGEILTRKMPSASPRRIASRRCEPMRFKGRTDAFQRRAEIEIIPILCPLLFFSFHHFGGDDSCVCERFPYGIPGIFVFIDPFGDDVACALQSLFPAFDLSFDKRVGISSKVSFLL